MSFIPHITVGVYITLFSVLYIVNFRNDAWNF